ncbi:hypothetical protein N5J44_10390 [Acinetobacter ursingii]|uniref:hypothetical protein n=1 Tax=Acinetobacter ursingii TaxID=108980 RepID=UPI00244C9E13|nr:hypothetical protein [Acinetobacter ursingii]MDH2019172.1 hypothetical protein [Acinetobacter ursingii]MDH2071942.1 hypothetical protein [Acinetobacter ursingii]
MPILIWIMSNKRWTVIIILLIFSFWKTWQTNHYAGELSKANTVCEAKVKTEVAKAVKPYIDAQKQAEINAQKASEDYEKTKESERIKTETITRTVQKIVERPIYINTCFDDDGVSAVNAAGNTR